MQEAPVVVGGSHGGDGGRPVGLSNPLDFPGDGVQGFVPGDADVLVFAAQLRMPFAVRVEMLAPQRVLDAVRCENPGFLDLFLSPPS